MSDPALPLQKALVAALKGDADITAVVGDRIYDTPPMAAAYPYVTLGEDQILPDRGDGGYEGSDVTLTLHVWSRATGFPEAKRVAAATRAALAGGLTLEAGTRLVDLTFEEARFLREPDGVTSHGVLTFTALTEPA
ncbi:DUF3168 domain-containing protein [uncultured Enterovirga sp.]|uniref:DUF3168 domain-containing protein n=1 Tax=uncultured Enterovirga sp. TaxID=2026352 RepID=UPI0035CBFE5F